MSDEIFFDGTKFVPAGAAALSAGLTRDYAARLCREGKLFGHRVGTQWYVNPDSFNAFLARQEYSKELRRESLSKTRSEEYQGSASGSAEPVRVVRSAAPLSSASRSHIRTHQMDVRKLFADALQKGNDQVFIGANKAVSAPAGFAHAALTVPHIPVHAISPLTEFFHKLIALTLALALTFGTYALVDPRYASYALEKMHSDIESVLAAYRSTTGGGIGVASARAQSQLAAAAEDPTGATRALTASVYESVAHIAQALNANVDAVVYSIAFPQQLVLSLGIVDTSRARVAVSIGSTTPEIVQLSAAPSTSTQVLQPIVQRIETTKIFSAGGITEDILSARLQELDNKLSSKMYSLTAANSSSPYAPAPVISLAQATRIDQLAGVDITSSTWSGGSISGASITGTSVAATTLSASGQSTLATTTVNGDLTVNGVLGVQNISLSSTTVTITGTSGQTQNFLDIKNASGTTVFAVQPDGTLISNISSTTQSVSQLLVTGNATATNIVILQTASSSNILATNGTTTNATSTNLFATLGHFTTGIIDTLTATIANITGLTATNATTTNATTTNLAVTNLTSFTAPIAPYFTATSSSATSTFAGGMTVTGTSMFNGGLLALASSTVGDGTQVGGLTISGGATTTGDLVISKASSPMTGNLYFGNGTAHLNYNSSDFTLYGGSIYTNAGRIVSIGDNEDIGLGVRHINGDGTYYLGASHSFSPDLIFSNTSFTERARLTDAGFFGIGTTSPWAQLAVSGIAGSPAFAVGSSTTQFIVDKNGNVGVGTVSPQTALDVVGNSYIRNAAGVAGSNDGVEMATDSSAPRVSLVQGGRYVGLFSGDAPGNTYLKNVAGGSLLFYGSTGGNIELARLTNSGSLAVGTTSPYASLSIVGGASGAGTIIGADAISGFSGKLLDLKLASTTKFSVDQAGTLVLGTALGQSYGGTGISSYTAGDILYADNSGNLAKLPIGSSGNVLTVQAGLPAWGVSSGGGGGGSSYNMWATTTLNLIYPVSTAYPVSIGANATSSSFSIFEVHGIQYNSSKIGIATTSPATDLSVEGSGYFSGGLGIGKLNTTAGTLQTSGDATIGGNLTVSSVTGSTLLYANGSKIVSSVSLDPSLTLTTGTLAVNMANPNTWTALQIFANASSTLFSNVGTAYFGGTSTTTIDSTGRLTIPAAAGANVIPYASTTALTATNLFAHATTTFDATIGVKNDFFGAGGHWQQGIQTYGSTNIMEFGVNGSSDAFTFGYGTPGSLTRALTIQGTGNVGIGTTSPWKTLSVAGDIIGTNITATGTLAVSTLTSGRIPFVTTGGALTDSSALAFDSALSRLTTTYASSTALTLSGGLYTTGSSDVPLSGAQIFGINGWWGIRGDSSSRFNIDTYHNGNNQAVFTIDQLGNTSIGTSTSAAQLTVWADSQSNTLLNLVDNSSSTVMTVKTAGNVGIGTTNPWTKLSVSGGLGVMASSTIGNGTQTGGLTISGGATTTGASYFGDALTINSSNASYFKTGDVYLGTGATLWQGLGGTPDLSVEGYINTNAGLNTVSDAKFGQSASFSTALGGSADIAVEGYVNANTGVVSGGGSASQPGISFSSSNNTGIWNTGTNGTSGIGFTTVGTERARIDSSGNFGIGTTTPWAKFSIGADGVSGPIIAVGSSTATYLTLTNGGLFGIGTTTPGSILSIQGVGNFVQNATSTLYNGLGISGNIDVRGTATSTFANGISISSGCFAINGTCLSAGSGDSYVVKLAAIYATSTPSQSGVPVSVVFTGSQGSSPSFSGATLTLPSNTSYLTVELVGGGGGGAGSSSSCPGSSTGGNGGASAFGTGSATTTGDGGSGGACNTAAGGAGGSATGGDVNITGGTGGGGGVNAGTSAAGDGGSSPFGGAGISPAPNGNPGSAAIAGTGSGGSGGTGTSAAFLGSGGGAGGYARKLYAAPLASRYYYDVGAGGRAGAAGGSGVVGGAGASGSVIIYVYATSSPNAQGNDYAEMFPVSHPSITAGDIVAVDTGIPVSMKRAVANDPAPLAGVIATKPGQLLGDPEAAGQRPVALSGRVPVKVNLEGGPLKTGDRIAVSSVPGVGKKAGIFDDSVGTALDDYDGKEADADGIGHVTVFLDLQRGIDINAIALGLLGGDAVSLESSAASTTFPSSAQSGQLDFVGGVMKAIAARLGAFVYPSAAPLQAGTSTISASSSIAAAPDGYADGFLRTLFSAFVGWFADAMNGIGKFFAISVHTRELCLSDEVGSTTCITKPQFDALIAAASAAASDRPARRAEAAPAIRILGNNPAVIPTETNYVDLGAVVSDDKDHNLGIHILLNDKEVVSVSLDTSTSTEYRIVYRATDTDGNTTEVYRRVIVYDRTQVPPTVDPIPPMQIPEAHAIEQAQQSQSQNLSTTSTSADTTAQSTATSSTQSASSETSTSTRATSATSTSTSTSSTPESGSGSTSASGTTAATTSSSQSSATTTESQTSADTLSSDSAVASTATASSTNSQ